MTGKVTGVYETSLKDGTKSYRASITFRGKHIALGSFADKKTAGKVYDQAAAVLSDSSCTIDSYKKGQPLPFEKFVVLINFRDKGLYIPTPIYLEKKYFFYYLSPSHTLIFDIDDLFYYSSHKIMKRGSHLFVADYGSQVSILSRYGIRSYAVEGRDYRFANGNSNDLRYENIQILNRYHGVRQYAERGFLKYKVVIHVNGNFVVGKYNTENEAAIAYNKAADILKKNGYDKNYMLNYIEDLSASEYATLYTSIRISPKIMKLSSPSGKSERMAMDA
ncbi:AP2 domain-containing protein [Butyrivibrio sp. AD3002]|uniref:AP2 domain-containing protein n=1 Tax=Butyrivibrio sp. AD3002 TaxID=1280670 RepID=UPI0003B427EC|nr:AP2 domain-containing protein [Butyrivibrio sp. AD3002]